MICFCLRASLPQGGRNYGGGFKRHSVTLYHNKDPKRVPNLENWEPKGTVHQLQSFAVSTVKNRDFDDSIVY